MRKLLLLNCFIIGLLFILFFQTQKIFAQTASTAKTPEEIAKDKGITFPIGELGNCKNYSECRNFCDDPLNKDACMSFAKKKGFYKDQADSQKNEILTFAKTEIGCDNPSSCQALCSKVENHDKCEAFAKSHGLSTAPLDPSKSQILERAKALLGCDSPSSCKAFCEQEQNKAKCSDFAKQVGLRGGEVKTGPGGCTSEETCKKFCSDPNNFEICQKFQGALTGRSESFHGPGGCNSPEACKTYCEKNPHDCQNIKTQFNPQETCSKTPNCSWTGSTCQCSGSYGFSTTSPATSSGKINTQNFCNQYPERCRFQASPSQNSPYPIYSPLPYPSSYSNKTIYPYPSGQNYPLGSSYPNPSSNITPFPTSAIQVQPQIPTQTQYPTQIQASPYPTYQPTGSVHGASTNSLFQTILQTLLRL